MNDLFDGYREKTKRPAPVDFASSVISRLAVQQDWRPSLGAVLGSSVQLAAVVAFTLTFFASERETPPPPASTLFRGLGGEMILFRP